MDRALTQTKAVCAPNRPLSIAIVGSGISGMSAAWLLSQRHNVTLYEQDRRLGGHTNTIEATIDGRRHPVDTGFIVYNEQNYPNLTALFRHLGVATQPTDMSFGVSLDNGRLEYASMGLRGLFAQYRNAIRPRFWMMIRDLIRFYREAPRSVAASGSISRSSSRATVDLPQPDSPTMAKVSPR